jgi:hypothetical protein
VGGLAAEIAGVIDSDGDLENGSDGEI